MLWKVLPFLYRSEESTSTWVKFQWKVRIFSLSFNVIFRTVHFMWENVQWKLSGNTEWRIKQYSLKSSYTFEKRWILNFIISSNPFTWNFM